MDLPAEESCDLVVRMDINSLSVEFHQTLKRFLSVALFNALN